MCRRNISKMNWMPRAIATWNSNKWLRDYSSLSFYIRNASSICICVSLPPDVCVCVYIGILVLGYVLVLFITMNICVCVNPFSVMDFLLYGVWSKPQHCARDMIKRARHTSHKNRDKWIAECGPTTRNQWRASNISHLRPRIYHWPW